MSNLRKFEHILNEGISQEDLANVLCHRIEMRYPDIYKKYDYDAMYNAVDDVASFHAGAEELGNSDINIMIRQVFKRLEESEGVAEGSLTDKQQSYWDSAAKEKEKQERDSLNAKKAEHEQTPIGKAEKYWGKKGVAKGSSSKLSSPFEGGRKTTTITPKHKPLVWENMLGTVMAKDPTSKAEPKYFDYRWEDARAYAKVDQCDDLRICKSPGLYQGWPEKGKMALWGILRKGVAEGYKEPTDAAGHAKMAAKIKRMLDDTLADRGDRHGNPDPQRLTRAYEYHMKKAEEKSQGVAEEKGTLWRVHQSEATGRYHVVKGYNKDIKMYKNKMGAGDFNSKASAQAKADELNKGVSEDQLDELKCWDGYKRVPGTTAGEPGSCEKIKEGDLNELSTDRLAKYKTASAADARAADKAGDFARGNKRFAGIVKATKKQFDNDTKPKKESAIMKGLVDENLGTPYPGTYEQEYGPYKRKGQERTMKIAFEGKKNVSRRT